MDRVVAELCIMKEQTICTIVLRLACLRGG